MGNAAQPRHPWGAEPFSKRQTGARAPKWKGTGLHALSTEACADDPAAGPRTPRVKVKGRRLAGRHRSERTDRRCDG